MRVCPGCRGTFGQDQASCPQDGLPLLELSRTFAGADAGGYASKPDVPLEPGMLVAEYRVEGLLAVGGMGAVYAAIHPVISKRVAIKVLNRRFAQDPKAVARFVLEARAVNQIGHHNIVDIFAIGELDDGRNYLVMELLDGLGLHLVLAGAQRLEAGHLPLLFEQLCDALDAAHAKGFIHRDLKPENVIVLRRPPHPLIKILDFGIAKLRGGSPSEETQAGMVLGTPEYMAPEQCRGLGLDVRADVYSLGVMLFELVTGRKPFVDPNPVRVMTMQLRDKPPRPSQLAPVPAALEAVILKAMAKRPAERYSSAGELMEHLRAAVPDVLPWKPLLSRAESTLAAQRPRADAAARRAASAKETPLPADPPGDEADPTLPSVAPSLEAPGLPAPGTPPANEASAAERSKGGEAGPAGPPPSRPNPQRVTVLSPVSLTGEMEGLGPSPSTAHGVFDDDGETLISDRPDRPSRTDVIRAELGMEPDELENTQLDYELPAGVREASRLAPDAAEAFSSSSFAAPGEGRSARTAPARQKPPGRLLVLAALTALAVVIATGLLVLLLAR
ncbi:MAG: protein kinase [Deltaproteobacteria bacterium]|nr:protein kinase [Deltaproteobacteria bacterium]